MRIIIILFFCLLNVAAWSGQSDLYRWQDANGQWHFGDAASSNGQPAQTVELPPEAQNVVRTPKIKPVKTKTTKVNTKISHNKAKQETRAQKKLRCDKKRDELRFQAFRTEERNQYDHDCISEMKW
jgi:hypothetical protein